MTPRLLLVVGLQKSGTSLLARLLQQVAGLPPGGRGEGDELWGNVPALSPAEEPVGRIYQRSGGAAGHVVEAGDATPEARDLLQARLLGAGGGAELVLNKNPYNTVRLRWLRAMLPDAVIVAMIRAPVPNVYSLIKKHHPHDGRGRGPEEGWWGVKPAGWRDLVTEDKVTQCARQWAAVNAVLGGDREVVDVVVDYRRLCADPAATLRRVLDAAGVAPAPLQVPRITDLDDEHLRGARLQSKNREFRRTGSFAVPDDEPVELPAFAPADVEQVRATCASTAALFPELACG